MGFDVNVWVRHFYCLCLKIQSTFSLFIEDSSSDNLITFVAPESSINFNFPELVSMQLLSI